MTQLRIISAKAIHNLIIMQGRKLAPARWPRAGKLYVGPVEILSRQVKSPITSIQIMEFGSFWRGR